jgi:hypothetical protein
MITSTDTRIVSFFNDINGRVRDEQGRFVGSAKSTTGYLYVTANNCVQIVLPDTLLDYANAASGTMSGMRPVGIRLSVSFNTAEQAADEVVKIFNSPESLAKFINTSECDAPEYVPNASKPTKSVKSVLIDERFIKDAFYDAGYDFDTIIQLRKLFGTDTVAHDWKYLTINEFQLRYNLA